MFYVTSWLTPYIHHVSPARAVHVLCIVSPRIFLLKRTCLSFHWLLWNILGLVHNIQRRFLFEIYTNSVFRLKCTQNVIEMYIDILIPICAYSTRLAPCLHLEISLCLHHYLIIKEVLPILNRVNLPLSTPGMWSVVYRTACFRGVYQRANTGLQDASSWNWSVKRGEEETEYRLKAIWADCMIYTS